MPSRDITLCVSARLCGFTQCRRNLANYLPGVYSMADFGQGVNFKTGCPHMLTLETYTPKKEGKA